GATRTRRSSAAASDASARITPTGTAKRGSRDARTVLPFALRVRDVEGVDERSRHDLVGVDDAGAISAWLNGTAQRDWANDCEVRLRRGRAAARGVQPEKDLKHGR